MRGSQLKCEIQSLKLEIDFLNNYGAKNSESCVDMKFLDASGEHSRVETLIVHRRRWFPGLRSNHVQACSSNLFEYLIAIKLCEVLHPSSWPQLRTLVLNLELPRSSVHAVIAALKDFPLSTLKDITIELRFSSIWNVNSELFDNSSQELELEQTLLRFPRPKVIIFPNHLRLGRSSFWTQEMGKHYFPVLFQRGAFKVTCETGAHLILSQFWCEKRTDFYV